jgi:hypothetical protein
MEMKKNDKIILIHADDISHFIPYRQIKSLSAFQHGVDHFKNKNSL